MPETPVDRLYRSWQDAALLTDVGAMLIIGSALADALVEYDKTIKRLETALRSPRRV
jgi:hypothetical protein